jgi:uncharacterized SAM-binding protein YcdF (DUF218 family)
MNRFLHIIKQFLRIVTGGAGILFILLIILSFTQIPFDMHRWLGNTGAAFNFKPTTIIMLGGSGMPSESNLIRLNYTKDIALALPGTRVCIVHPDDSMVLKQMTDFLEAFKIAPSRIIADSHGTNTREQALKLKITYPEMVNEKLVVVTSPENMYRTIKTFRQLGFEAVGGVPAFENAMFVDLAYNHKKVGGRQFVPDVSGNLGLRYNFWNYLKLEITCLREFAAITYYWLNGWI